MATIPLSSPVIERLADRLRALGEANRLAILSILREGERTVTELVDATGLGQANVSKHLRVLYQEGFVARRKEGLNVVYRIADQDVFRICDLLCGRLEREARDWSSVLQSPVRRPSRKPRGRLSRTSAR